MSITAQTSVCMIIGDPVAHSRSPAMHNAAYCAVGVPYVMVGAHVQANDLPRAIAGFKALNLKGLSVTMPHKVSILPLLDQIDPTAEVIGAVNTVVHSESKLVGYNTDWLGILKPLERLCSLRGRRIAILGAGGAAQAALYAVTSRGARVTIFNRSADRAHNLAARWDCTVSTLSAIDEIRTCEIIINTTSVGMGELASLSPVAPEALHKEQIVFETIYAPRSTPLVRAAEACGARVIYGLDMFLDQGIAQFELHTGVKPPRTAMENALRDAPEA